MEEPVPKETQKVPRAQDYLRLVGAIARTLSRGLPPTVELDELINDGVIGLIEALRRYDPDRGVGFSTYAGHRIRGAMLDGLRTRDPLPRRLRRAQRAAQADPRNQTAGRGVQFLEIDNALLIPEDDAFGPEARVLEEELLHDLHRGMLELPPRDRQVLLLRMARGMTLRAVADHLQLSITRIAEIQTRGIVRLRRFLAGEPMFRPRGPAGPKSGCPPLAGGCPSARPRPKIVTHSPEEERAAEAPNDSVTPPVASTALPLTVGAQ